MFNIPLFCTKFRECDRSYIIFADENIPEEQTPWATIITTAPLIPHEVTETQPAIMKAICTTEEYAIITFRSLKLTHTALSILPPNRARIKTPSNTPHGLSRALTRIIPYPPSLSKTPAKIIDPPTGASTWALGNHW